MNVQYHDGLDKKQISRMKELAEEQPTEEVTRWICKNQLQLTDYTDPGLRPKDTILWALYSPELKGYETALERIPYFEEAS